jgi:Domain of unknown function (DUF4345)
MTMVVERRLLQAAIALGCIVPLFAGCLGVAYGASMAGSLGGVTLDSHFRYLSGLLLGIGVGFASVIAAVETHGQRVTLLTALVVSGGLARLYGVVCNGWPASTMTFALGMELFVVPALWLWQRRVARHWPG